MYNLIYLSEFTSIGGEDYNLFIYKKDYIGTFQNVIAASQPVIHKWQTDEPKASIKGSSLEIRLINESGQLPLINFFSVEDDAFKVVFKHGANTLFEGYLVQDDCTEEVIDYTHEIILSATDNLGLLKDVSLLDASVKNGTATDYDVTLTYGSTAQPIGGLTIDSNTVDITAGDILVIGYPIFSVDTEFIVTSAVVIGANTEVDIEPDIYFFTTTPTTITVRRPVNLKEKVPLTDLLKICILSTGLELNTHVYSQLIEVNSGALRFLEHTYLSGESFLNGEAWQSCYDVLDIILTRFKATLFQSNGVWNIIRQDERRYYNNAILGYNYDSDFVYVDEVNLSDNFIIGIDEDSYAETGLTKSILRPYKSVKETFNYKQPSNLLRNADFQKLGNLITSYINPDDATQMVYEYEMAEWDQGFYWSLGGGVLHYTTVDRFIRVVRDSVGEEVDRYGVISGDEFPDYAAGAVSQPIEISQNDALKLSFDFKTSQSISGPASAAFTLVVVTTANLVPRGADNRYLNGIGKWSTSRGASYQISGGDNFNEWHTFEVTSDPLPFGGTFYVMLAQWATDDTETHYKNIRFEVFNSINGVTKIIGHTHTDSQMPVIKNKYDEEIFVDDSPRNSINGTLFLPSFTGALQDRTGLWNVGTTMFDDMKLGNLTTRDELYHRRLPRTKLEGTIYGLVQDTHLSMLTAFRHTHASMSDLNFNAGMMSIDYVNNNFSGTLWEMFKDTEYTVGTITFEALAEVYEFKYLFEKQ